MAKQKTSTKITINIPINLNDPNEKKIFNMWRTMHRTTLTENMKQKVLSLIQKTAQNLLQQCQEEAGTPENSVNS